MSKLNATICAYREDGEALPIVGSTKERSARGAKGYAYLRRRGVSNVAELYMNQTYGHVTGSIGR